MAAAEVQGAGEAAAVRKGTVTDGSKGLAAAEVQGAGEAAAVKKGIVTDAGKGWAAAKVQGAGEAPAPRKGIVTDGGKLRAAEIQSGEAGAVTKGSATDAGKGWAAAEVQRAGEAAAVTKGRATDGGKLRAAAEVQRAGEAFAVIKGSVTDGGKGGRELQVDQFLVSAGKRISSHGSYTIAQDNLAKGVSIRIPGCLFVCTVCIIIIRHCPGTFQGKDMVAGAVRIHFLRDGIGDGIRKDASGNHLACKGHSRVLRLGRLCGFLRLGGVRGHLGLSRRSNIPRLGGLRGHLRLGGRSGILRNGGLRSRLRLGRFRCYLRFSWRSGILRLGRFCSHLGVGGCLPGVRLSLGSCIIPCRKNRDGSLGNAGKQHSKAQHQRQQSSSRHSFFHIGSSPFCSHPYPSAPENGHLAFSFSGTAKPIIFSGS